MVLNDVLDIFHVCLVDYSVRANFKIVSSRHFVNDNCLITNCLSTGNIVVSKKTYQSLKAATSKNVTTFDQKMGKTYDIYDFIKKVKIMIFAV